MKSLHTIAYILLIIGGLNWLLTAFDWNLVDYIFGMDSIIAMVIYILVGLSALYEIFTHKSRCKNCESKMPMAGSSM